MRWLSLLAFVLSLTALSISIWTWQQADSRAEAALQRREKALVDKHRPAVVKMCREYGINPPPENVQTVDELLAPLGGLFTGLSK